MEFFVIFFSLFCTSTVSSVPYRFNIIESPGITVWKIEEHTDPVTVAYDKFMEFSFNDAFIVMYKSFNLEVNVFYWLGGNASLDQRNRTACLTGLLIKQIFEERSRIPTFNISREVDGIESEAFARIFNLAPGYLQKLYRVTGSAGQFIFEVPCSYENLNRSDSWVLDCRDGIYVWNAHKSWFQKRYMAAILAEGIKRIQNERNVEIFTLNFGPHKNPKFYEYFIQKFFGNIPYSVNKFPTNVSTEDDSQLMMTRQYRIVLTEYSLVSEINETVIVNRPLQLNMFQKEKAYIMNVYYSQNTFVYFGENSNPELFPYVLAKAEYSFYNVSQNNSTYYEAAKKKIKIIYGEQELPLQFLVNFDEALHELYKESIKLMNNTNN